MTVLVLLLSSCGMKGPPRLPLYEIPHAPQNIEVNQRSHPREVILKWDYPEAQMDSIEGFVVVRLNGGGADREVIVNGTSFTDSKLDENRIYTYSISAISLRGIHGDSSIPLVVNPVSGLTKPLDLTFDIGWDKINLNWKYPEHSARFNVYKDGAPVPITREPVHEMSLQIAPTPDTTASYIVRAVKDTNILTEGPPSDEIVIGPEDYIPSSPLGLGFAVTDRKVLLFWDENPEIWIWGYRVYRSFTQEGEFLPVGTSETPAFEDTDYASGKRFYKIRAFGPVKEGPSSETISVELNR